MFICCLEDVLKCTDCLFEFVLTDQALSIEEINLKDSFYVLLFLLLVLLWLIVLVINVIIFIIAHDTRINYKIISSTIHT